MITVELMAITLSSLLMVPRKVRIHQSTDEIEHRKGSNRIARHRAPQKSIAWRLGPDDRRGHSILRNHNAG